MRAQAEALSVVSSDGSVRVNDGRSTTDPPLVDTHNACASLAADGECENNPSFMASNCAATCKRRKDGKKGSRRKKPPSSSPSPPKGPVDKNEHCGAWASAGECDANPGFMLESCPVSCNACPAGDEDPACVRRNSTPAVRDRGIAAVFERALREYPQYKVRARVS